MATIVISDSAQYYTGRAFGRRPLAPAISPKKTVRGRDRRHRVRHAGLMIVGGTVVLPTRRVLVAASSLARAIVGCSASSAICSSRCSSAAPA